MSWRLTACGQDCRRVQKTGRAIERFYSVEVRAAIPAMHINTMDPLIEMFRGAGFARASARPTMSKFAIIAQTG
jgi:hypothetical protein